MLETFPDRKNKQDSAASLLRPESNSLDQLGVLLAGRDVDVVYEETGLTDIDITEL